jgi:hypothetical protein
MSAMAEVICQRNEEDLDSVPGICPSAVDVATGMFKMKCPMQEAGYSLRLHNPCDLEVPSCLEAIDPK